MNIEHFTIAGMRIRLHSPIPFARLGLQQRLGPFLSSPSDSPAEAVVSWSEGDPIEPSGDLVFDPGDIWRMYRDPAGPAFHAHIAYPSSEGPGSRALLTANPAWNDLSLTEPRDGDAWSSLLALGAGELLVRTRILFNQGIVFHASGIDDNGRGILFVGHSGAGKSTQAALWAGIPGVCAMNDDRMAVRLDGPGPVAYGLPWGRTADIACNRQAPLSAIFLVEQAPQNSARQLTPSSSIPLLLPRSFLPYWDEALLDRAFQTIAAIAARVPVYALKCTADPSVVPFLRSLL